MGYKLIEVKDAVSNDLLYSYKSEDALVDAWKLVQESSGAWGDPADYNVVETDVTADVAQDDIDRAARRLSRKEGRDFLKTLDRDDLGTVTKRKRVLLAIVDLLNDKL